MTPDDSPATIAVLEPDAENTSGPQLEKLSFTGATAIHVANPNQFDMTQRDFTVGRSR